MGTKFIFHLKMKQKFYWCMMRDGWLAENIFCFINGSCIQKQQHMASSPPQYKMFYLNLRIGSLNNFVFSLKAVFSPLFALTSSIFDTSVFQILLPKKFKQYSFSQLQRTSFPRVEVSNYDKWMYLHVLSFNRRAF